MEFVRDNSINYWPTPAESPDMNPIEMLWHELKSFLRRIVKPKNKEELVEGIQQFWQTVTPENASVTLGTCRRSCPKSSGVKERHQAIKQTYPNNKTAPLGATR